MDILDLLDMGSGSSGSSGGLLGSIVPSRSALIATIWVIGIIGLLVIAYGFAGFTRRNIGRKAGLQKDWMAFVPFARTIYFLEVVGEQWWKMFIFEMWFLWYFVIGWIFGLFENDTMYTLGSVLQAFYIFGVIGYKIYFRVKFCKTFNIKSDAAIGLAATTWGVFFLRRVFECLIAFTDLFQYGDASLQRGFGEVTVPGPKAAPARVGGGAPSPVRAAPSGTGCSLTGMSGMYAGQEIPLAVGDEIIVGRDATLANIIVDQMADKVSRKHCGIRFDPARGTYMVTDYSSNGTFVDGGSRLVANVPQPCNRGTIIALGSRENRFRLN